MSNIVYNSIQEVLDDMVDKVKAGIELKVRLSEDPYNQELCDKYKDLGREDED